MFKKIVKCYDYKFIVALIVLSLIGLVMVYSASMVTAVSRYGVEGDYFYQKQKLALIAGFIFFCFAAFIPYKIYQEKKVLKIQTRFKQKKFLSQPDQQLSLLFLTPQVLSQRVNMAN